MVLSTVDPDGRPSARFVLLKGVDARGFVFFTNLESRKAKALAAHPHAALTVYWPPQTQVRIEGRVERGGRRRGGRGTSRPGRAARRSAPGRRRRAPSRLARDLDERVREVEARFDGGDRAAPAVLERLPGDPLDD